MEKKILISDAIVSLRPGSEWTIESNSYSTLVWLSKDTIAPTEEEVLIEIERIAQEYIGKEYQRARTTAYPSIEEQLDMIYWDKINNTTTWENLITKIKQDNPKPKEGNK